MKSNWMILLGLAGNVAATSVQDLPSCALGCYAQAVGNTTCGLTDSYCQCTTGYQKILDTAIPCLCHSSDCATEDLIAAQQDTNKICSSALSAKGEKFSAATFGLNVCAAAATVTATGTGTVASVSASATGSSDHSGSNSGSTDTSFAAHVGTEDSMRLMWEAVVIAVVGTAVLAL